MILVKRKNKNSNMIKIHYEIDKFDNKELLKGYNGIIKKEFNNNNYFIELYQDDKKLIALKANEGLLFINGDYILLDDLVKNIIYLGLNFETVLINKLIEEQFIGLVEKEQGGRFIKLKSNNEEYSLLEYTKGNVKSCVLAGGCFWCMSKPYYEYDGIINETVANESLDILKIDEFGLDTTDRALLNLIIDKYDGGPVGVETIAAALSEDVRTIEDVCEPYLLQAGFLQRTPRGRKVSPEGYRHLGLKIPSEQKTLFEF